MKPPRPERTQEEFWRTYDAVESRLTACVSERMLDLARVGRDMRVLDIASGRGEPALRAARRVGPQGFVLGVDLAEPLLRMAREAAAREGLSNVEFRAGNAESLEGVPSDDFHVATSRWGLMAMAAPVSALAATRRALRPDGVLVAALWAEPPRVAYYTLPRKVFERYRALPPLDPEAPGTFRYAQPKRIVDDFERAGFTVEALEEMEVPVIEAESSMALIDWVRGLGMTRLLDELPEARQRAWEDDLKGELEALRVGPLIQLGGVTRLVLARSRG